MDPLADKLLITAALLSLVQMDLAPAWMALVILGREFAVTILRSLRLQDPRGSVIPASPAAASSRIGGRRAWRSSCSSWGGRSPGAVLRAGGGGVVGCRRGRRGLGD